MCQAPHAVTRICKGGNCVSMGTEWPHYGRCHDETAKIAPHGSWSSPKEQPGHQARERTRSGNGMPRARTPEQGMRTGSDGKDNWGKPVERQDKGRQRAGLWGLQVRGGLDRAGSPATSPQAIPDPLWWIKKVLHFFLGNLFLYLLFPQVSSREPEGEVQKRKERQ